MEEEFVFVISVSFCDWAKPISNRGFDLHFSCFNLIQNFKLRRSSSMDRRKSREKTTAPKASTVEASPSISVSEAFIVNALCVLGLVFAVWAANTVFSIDLVSHPSLTLFFISVPSIHFFKLLVVFFFAHFSHFTSSFRL